MLISSERSLISQRKKAQLRMEPTRIAARGSKVAIGQCAVGRRLSQIGASKRTDGCRPHVGRSMRCVPMAAHGTGLTLAELPQSQGKLTFIRRHPKPQSNPKHPFDGGAGKVRDGWKEDLGPEYPIRPNRADSIVNLIPEADLRVIPPSAD